MVVVAAAAAPATVAVAVAGVAVLPHHYSDFISLLIILAPVLLLF